jgi:hypothetical protein
MEEVLMKKTIAVTTFSLTLLLACLSVAAQTPAQAQSRDDVIKEIEAKRAEIAALEKTVLAVAETDREEFAAFLTQPRTELIRLLPREKYDRKLMTIGGGAYYSFVRSTHEYGQGSDISLEQGQLGVGFAGADYGMLLNVGDMSLDQVTPEFLAARALLEYTPPTREPEVRAEYRKLWQGIELGGFTFKSRVPAKVANTYLLRSISVDRSDIVVAFRVVRKDTDGSIILVSKVLKTFPKPTMERTQTASSN